MSYVGDAQGRGEQARHQEVQVLQDLPTGVLQRGLGGDQQAEGDCGRDSHS